jgi:hypothetical protein
MKPPPNRVCGFLLRFLLQRSFVATPCRSSLTRGTCVVSTGGLVQRGAASHARRVGRAASARPPPYRRGAGRVEADRAARRTSAIRSRACVGVPTLYSDANVANRNVRGYGRVGPAHVYLHAARHTLRRFASPSPPPPLRVAVDPLQTGAVKPRARTAMKKLRIVILRFGTARQKRVLE